MNQTTENVNSLRSSDALEAATSNLDMFMAIFVLFNSQVHKVSDEIKTDLEKKTVSKTYSFERYLKNQQQQSAVSVTERATNTSSSATTAKTA